MLALVAAGGVVAVLFSATASGRRNGGLPVALVTAETQNELLAVSLPDGRVVRRVRLASDPENVASRANGPAVVVSAKGHTVSVLDWRSLRVLKTFRNFRSPHLAAFAPDGKWIYVTDDGSGVVSVIQLRGLRIVDRVFVGTGAHHLAFSPDERRVWIALGERARTIVVLQTDRVDRPRVLARFDPGFRAHDLVFSPNGTQVWVTSDTLSTVAVLSTKTGKVLFSVPAGPPPQHLAFGDSTHDAYVTSGYGSRIERVDLRGRVIREVATPYGSFNVATSGGLVVVSSLLDGTVTEFTDRLRRWQSVKVAPVARDVAISVW